MSTTPRRSNLVDELDSAAQRCGNLTVLFTNAIASRVGLSATEFECLSLLREGPLSAGRLAELCGLSTGGVTGLIDRLERSGHAERIADPGDRRRVLVAARENAELRDRAGRLYQPLALAFEELADQYSIRDLATVLRYFQEANAIMERLTVELHRQAK